MKIALFDWTVTGNEIDDNPYNLLTVDGLCKLLQMRWETYCKQEQNRDEHLIHRLPVYLRVAEDTYLLLSDIQKQGISRQQATSTKAISIAENTLYTPPSKYLAGTITPDDIITPAQMFNGEIPPNLCLELISDDEFQTPVCYREEYAFLYMLQLHSDGSEWFFKDVNIVSEIVDTDEHSYGTKGIIVIPSGPLVDTDYKEMYVYKP